MAGFFVQHPLGKMYPTDQVTHTCPVCKRVTFVGEARKVLDAYREHMLDAHEEILEDCGCCGGYHLPTFRGDCREDWERF